MRRGTALCVHHVELAVVAPAVGGRDRRHHVARGQALFQEAQALGTVKGIDQRLCRDRTSARFDMRYKRANSEETCRDCNSELPGILIASDDRPGHASHPQLRRSKGSNLTRHRAMRIISALWVVDRHAPQQRQSIASAAGEKALRALTQLRADALVIGPEVFFNTRIEHLGTLSLRHGVPTI